MFILTVRNDRLGDLILALPVLTALRARRPDDRLGAVVSRNCQPLFELYPEQIEVWVDDGAYLERLTTDRPDSMLFLYPDRTWTGAARRARVPERIGTRYRWHSWMYTQRVPLHRRGSSLHEAECNLRLAASLVGAVPLVPPRLVVNEAMQTEAGRLSRAAGLPAGRPFIAIHPGSRGSAWNWPAECYGELVRQLADSGHTVVVTGSESEGAICAEVAGRVAIDLSGRTSLTILAAVLERAAVMVSGSTGPMHLSAALGTPVVVLFSPVPGQKPQRWGPLGSSHTVLMPEGSSRRPDPEVMRTIRPDQVAAAVAKTLHTRATVT